MTKDGNSIPLGAAKPNEEVNFHATDKRGFQPIAVSAKVSIANGFQPATDWNCSTPSKPPQPPSQGSSAKK